MISFFFFLSLSLYVLTAGEKINANSMGVAMRIIVGASLVPSGSFPQRHWKEEVGAVLLRKDEDSRKQSYTLW